MKETESTTDLIGSNTLNVISKAAKFNEWMYAAIKPYCSGNILEIGSGIGNISDFFLNDRHKIFLSDLNEDYVKYLRNKSNSFPNLLGVDKVDLANINFDEKYKNLLTYFNTVFYLNVLEHIQDHARAIENTKKLLTSNGKLIILVPACPKLYCKFDEELGHYRRYTKKCLKQVVESNGFTIKKIFSFNSAGIAGWFLFGKILKRKQIEQNEMGLFNYMVPLFKFMDFISFRKIGLSIVIVAEKKSL